MNHFKLLYGFFAAVIVTTVVFSGCDTSKSDKKIRELSDIQSQEAAKNQVTAENQYLETKARTMESDLEKRQRFYQALAGTYEGAVRINQSDFKIRLTLSPSLPRYVPNDRIRTVEEVASDLNNLYLNVQIVQWNPATNFGSVGCLVTNVRPDIVKGRVNIVSEGCKSLYNFQIADGLSEVPDAPDTSDIQAARLAEAITDGKIESVIQISGRMQPTTNANVFMFKATRVQD